MNKSWTKYGGGRGGNEAIYKGNDWYCQSCSRLMSKDDTVFTFRHDVICLRVCQECAANDCEEFRHKLQT